MGVNESAKYQLAKTFTELAIQNDLIDKRRLQLQQLKKLQISLIRL